MSKNIDKKYLYRRAYTIYFTFVLLILVVLYTTLKLQLEGRSNLFDNVDKKLPVKVVKRVPRMGEILDMNGIPLVTSVTFYDIHMDPTVVKQEIFDEKVLNFTAMIFEQHGCDAWYDMEIKDLLVAKRIGDDQYEGVNAGKTFHEGIEIALKHNWTINRTFNLNSYVGTSIGNYEFKEFADNGNDYSGNKLTGVPANTASAGFNFNTNSGFYFSTDFQFTDKIPMNDSNANFSDSYSLLNLKTYQTNKRKNLVR